MDIFISETEFYLDENIFRIAVMCCSLFLLMFFEDFVESSVANNQSFANEFDYGRLSALLAFISNASFGAAMCIVETRLTDTQTWSYTVFWLSECFLWIYE